MDAERMPGATFALEDIGWIDFETKGRLPINVGTYRYATNADAMVCAWAIGNDPVRVNTAIGKPLQWRNMPSGVKEFHARVVRGQAKWAAWNAGFDRAVWNYATEGFPLMEPHHIIDVMAQAVASGLPPDLAQAAEQSHSELKLADGKKLIGLFCNPDSLATPRTHPDKWKTFLEYAAADVDAMRSVFLGTRQLPMAEWQEYWAMERVNERGIAIDVEMVAHAARLAEEDKHRSRNEIYALTGARVPSVDHVKPMVGWLNDVLPPEGRAMLLERAEEVGEDGEVTRPAKFSLTRKVIERLIAYCQAQIEQYPAKVQAAPGSDEREAIIRLGTELRAAERVLQIRRYGGSKTPAKFGKMTQQHVDGVLYGQYVFNGASQTGRASSRGVQIHNLARDTLPYEHDAVEALLNGTDYGHFAVLGDNAPVSRKLSLLIRPALVPQMPGNVFVWSDWSQIEARVLPWLAKNKGGEARLDIFREVDADHTKPDLYTRSAADISGIPIEQVTKPVRQRGKVAELALGFGGGVGALQAMAAGYGLHLGQEDSKQIVNAWRGANGWAVRFWEELQAAALNALTVPGTVFQAGRVAYVYLNNYLGGSLLCVLPSGRCLTYRNVRYENVAEKDDDDRITGYSTKLRFSRGYGRIDIWHGLLCENVVQATAADFLRGTLRRLTVAGHDVRLHTHDEILLEAAEDDAERVRGDLRYAMQAGFDWSEGLPVFSEETIAPYYTKQEI